MRVFLLLCLLALGNTKPYQPINVMDFLRNYDLMMADDEDDGDDFVASDDKDDDEDEEKDKDYSVEDENCPADCQCFLRVVQCSDQG